MTKNVLFSICLLLIAFQLSAVKARRSTTTFKQPNGYELQSKLMGDEFFHFRRTIDNYTLLTDSNGYMVYAVQLNNELIPSAVVAHNPSDRTADEKAFLQTIQPQLAFGTVTRQNANRKRAIRAVHSTGLQKKAKALTKSVSSPRYLVLLVNFKDNAFSVPTPNTRFSNQFNADNYTTDGATGSVRKYFIDNSMGAFTPQFDVYGPVTLSNNIAYYGGNDTDGNDLKPDEMVFEACQLLDSQIDFTVYDLDNDGEVDNVYVIYAGYGEASGAAENTIWPHQWEVTNTTKLDGKLIGTYSCSNELGGTSDVIIDGIGTACHEFSHAIGLLDLYDTDYEENGQSFDVDTWSLMAGGSYNNDGMTPPYYCALEREMLGWGTPVVLSNPANITVNSIGTNQFYRINSTVNNDYFLIENRQLTGWDEHLYTHGMLVYHIDKTSAYADRWVQNTLNAYSDHNCVDILEADAAEVFYTGFNYTNWLNSLKGDPFPGSANKTSLTDNTTPGLKSWSGVATGKPITDIAETNGIISFKFMGGEQIFGTFEALNATNVTGNSFTANWTAATNATKYLLNVYTKTTSTAAPQTASTGFDGYPATKPTDWTITTSSKYETTGNFGASSPSVKLDVNNASIVSPTFADAISSVSFWYKGNGTSGSTLKVEGSTDGTAWTTIEAISALPTNGTTKTISISTALAYKKLRLIYTKNSGNVGVDDVVIKYGQGTVVSSILKDAEVSTGTSFDVSGLATGTYYYTVKAANATEVSTESNEISVSLLSTALHNTTENSLQCWLVNGGIVVFSTTQQPFAIYNATGQIVHQQILPAGRTEITLKSNSLYVLKTTGYSSKIQTK